MKKVLLVIGSLLVGLSLNSQVLARTVELEPIVVTPYKTGMEAGQSGYDVDILDIKDEYSKGNYDLPSALRDLPAVMVTKTGGLGGDASIFLRGNNSYHTRFILDGIKLYDPLLTQSYYTPTHLHLNGIGRVEVSKGQQSSLYGSDAIGGVINLTTKPAEKYFGFSYQQEAGMFNAYMEQADMEACNDKIGMALSLLRLDSGGFSTTRERDGNTERDPYENMSGSARLDLDLIENMHIGLIGRASYAKYEYDGSNSITWLPEDDDERRSRDIHGMGTIFIDQIVTDKFKHKAQIGLTEFYRKYKDEADLIDDWYKSKTYQLSYNLEFQPWKEYKFIGGLDYSRDKGDYWTPSGGFPKEITYNRAFYIEQIITPIEEFMLAMSYRRDNPSIVEAHGTRSVSASYLIKLTNTRIKGAYGEGFKAPSIYQLHAPASLWGPIGNSELSPEESESYETGIVQKLCENRITAKATYFRTRFKNLIDFVSGSGYVNVGKAKINGFEASLSYKINDIITANFGYEWLQTKNKENGAPLSRRPENKAQLGVAGKYRKWKIDTGLGYVGHRTNDTSGDVLLKSYLLLNASVNYELNKNFDIYVRGENLLDKDYELVKDYQSKPFAVYGGCKVKF